MTALRTQAAQLAVAPPPAPTAGRTAPLPTAGRTAPLISEQYRRRLPAAAPAARAAPARRAPVEAPPPQSVHWQLKSALTQHMHELHEVLTALDTDGSGEVSRTEFAAALPTFQQSVPAATAADLAVLFDSLDPDSSGTINWREVYLTLGKSNKNELRGGELRKDVSKVFAKKGETLLADTSTATEAVTRLREALFENRQRVMALFLEWDVDGDSVVSKKEFRRGLSVLGFQTPNGRADVDALFDTFDPDGSGAIEYNELRRLLQAAPSAGGASTWAGELAPPPPKPAAAGSRKSPPKASPPKKRAPPKGKPGAASRTSPPKAPSPPSPPAAVTAPPRRTTRPRASRRRSRCPRRRPPSASGTRRRRRRPRRRWMMQAPQLCRWACIAVPAAPARWRGGAAAGGEPAARCARGDAEASCRGALARGGRGGAARGGDGRRTEGGRPRARLHQVHRRGPRRWRRRSRPRWEDAFA